MIEMPGVSSMRIGTPCRAAAAAVSMMFPVRSASRSMREFSARKRETICFASISSEKSNTGWRRRAMLKVSPRARLVLPPDGRAAEPSQDGSVAHHSRVALDLDGGGYRVRERVQVRLAACAIELLAPRKLDLDRERIDPLTAFEESLRRGVDPLVARDVEVVDAQEVGHLEDCVAIDEEASEHLLLGAFVER